MRSCLFRCHVMHARHHPRVHRFAYRIFMLALDLDELAELDRRLTWFSVDAGNVFALRTRDYCATFDALHQPDRERGAPAAEPPVRAPHAEADAGVHALKRRVLAFCADQGAPAPLGARVLLVTLPRVCGQVFNPVSFYFVTGPEGEPHTAIAEVTNTFRETKLFHLGPELRAPTPGVRPQWRDRRPKHFYVSPFSDVDVAFDLTLRLPDEKLLVRIDDFEGARRTLVSTLTGDARPLTDGELWRAFVRAPLVGLKVLAGIHWEALRLWRKKVPWFAKAARSDDQRDLRHPHASLSQRSPATGPRPAYAHHTANRRAEASTAAPSP